MAGNNSIQFLRGTSAQRATHTETSLAGQPIYETDTNKLYIGDGVTAVNALRPVNSISDYWEAVEQGFITPLIGETKTIKIGGTAYKIQCIGLNHDDLVSGGKAKTTWQLVDCYTTHSMNSNNTNAGGWQDCEMRSWLNGTVLSTITDENGNDLSSKIKQVIKRTANGGSDNYSAIEVSNDYLFLPSFIEVFGVVRSTNSSYAYPGEGNQYEFYSEAPIPEPLTGSGQFTPIKEHSSTGTFWSTNSSEAKDWIDRFGNVQSMLFAKIEYNYNCIKAEAGEANSTWWWLRSANSTSTTRFCATPPSGSFGANVTNTSQGVAFCFCV